MIDHFLVVIFLKLIEQLITVRKWNTNPFDILKMLNTDKYWTRKGSFNPQWSGFVGHEKKQ